MPSSPEPLIRPPRPRRDLIGPPPAVLVRRVDGPLGPRRSLREDRRLLRQIAGRLNTTLDINEILVEMMQLAHERFGYGNVGIFLADPDREWLRLRATYGDFVDPIAHQFYRQHAGTGLLGKSFLTGRTIRVDEVHRDPDYLDVFDGTRAELCVPLRVRDRVVGVIDIQLREADVFQAEDQALLHEIADHLAAPLYHAGIYEESERRRVEATALADAAYALVAQMSEEDVFAELRRQVERVVHCDNLQVVLESDVADGEDRALERRAIVENRPIALRAEAGSVLVAPLRATGSAIGCLRLERRGPDVFHDEHARFVGALATQAAAAMQNAHLLAAADRARVDLARSRDATIEAEERLRREIAEFLHSRVQSRLVVVWHRLGECAGLVESEPDTARELILRLRDEIDQVREVGLRRASHLLHPAIVDLGLVPAVRSLVSRFEEMMTIALVVDPAVTEMDDPIESSVPAQLRLAAYRVVEEALGNAQRHAAGAPVRVELRLGNEGKLMLSISDEGPGFDPETVTWGLGLASIAGRVDQLGGTWRLEAAPARGTTLRAAFPLIRPVTA